MKNRRNLLFLFILMTVLLLYRFDISVAMANTWTDADAMAKPESGQSPGAVPESQPDYVSTGTELVQWLESHKRTGGVVKLTDNVVLDRFYCFSPDRINLPSIFVDAGRYTITVAGEVEFWSDNHLIFQGQGNANGILRVSKGGLLTLSGITVQGGALPQCALWQEEGAGLVVDNCDVSGNIRYADTPYVIHDNSVSVIVEDGQTAGDVLPSAIKCDVNYQGGVNYNELVPVSWNLRGTQDQQKKRRRFYVQGTFSRAAFMEPPVCTVIYNDHPLTFTDIQAQASARAYLFRMWYTKPEEELPIEVSAEYSFDGKNWILYDKYIAENSSDNIFMGLTPEQWDAAEHPYIYLRLQWDNGGILYYSNVLRYAADNLKNADDQGGTRGGGTSIVNPPDKPQNGGNTAKPDNNAIDNNSNKDPGNDNNPNTADNHNKKSLDKDAADNPDITDIRISEHNSPYTELADNETWEQSPEESISQTSGESVSQSPGDSIPEISENIVSQTSGEDLGETSKETAASVDTENEEITDIQEPKTEPDVSQNRNTVIVMIFAALCVIAGGFGFCIRAGIFGRLIHKVKRTLFK